MARSKTDRRRTPNPSPPTTDPAGVNNDDATTTAGGGGGGGGGGATADAAAVTNATAAGATTTIATTTALTPSTTTESSMTTIPLPPWTTTTYIILWCCHLLTSVLDTSLLGIENLTALDSRPLMDWDYLFLMPLCLVVLVVAGSQGLRELTSVTTVTAGTIGTGTTTTTTTTTTPAAAAAAAEAAAAADSGDSTKTPPTEPPKEEATEAPPPSQLGIVEWAVIAHLVDFMIKLKRMPYVWDHEFWGTLVNLAFVMGYGKSVLMGTTPQTSYGENATAETHFFLPTARLQLGVLYVAATFWKLNTSFVHPTTSCGTVLVMEFVGAYTTSLFDGMTLSSGFLTFVTATAPVITILTELTIGIGILYGALLGVSTTAKHKMIRNATVLHATLFHVMICMMPVNAACGFSLECMTRLILLFDSHELETVLKPLFLGAAQYMQQALLDPPPPPPAASEDDDGNNAGVATATTTTTTTEPPKKPDWKTQYRFMKTAIVPSMMIRIRQLATDKPFDVGFSLALIVATLYYFIISETYKNTNDKKEADNRLTKSTSKPPAAAQKTSSKKGNKTVKGKKVGSIKPQGTTSTLAPKQSPSRPPPPSPTFTLGIRSILSLVLTVIYGFVLPILGLQQMGGPTMYSNLRGYRGVSNHYLVPTPIMDHKWLYGGGLIRVVSSNATAINRLLGYMDSREVFPDHVMNHLTPLIRNPDHSMLGLADMPLQFFPYCMQMPPARDVLMPAYQKANPPGTELFAPFIMPMFAVQRALWEDKELGDPFVVQFIYPAYYDDDDDDDDQVRQRHADDGPPVLVEINEKGHCRIGPTSLFDGTLPTSPFRPCTEDDVLPKMLMSDPNKWSRSQQIVSKILIPYPEIVGTKEEVCMS